MKFPPSIRHTRHSSIFSKSLLSIVSFILILITATFLLLAFVGHLRLQRDYIKSNELFLQQEARTAELILDSFRTYFTSAFSSLASVSAAGDSASAPAAASVSGAFVSAVFSLPPHAVMLSAITKTKIPANDLFFIIVPSSSLIFMVKILLVLFRCYLSADPPLLTKHCMSSLQQSKMD